MIKIRVTGNFLAQEESCLYLLKELLGALTSGSKSTTVEFELVPPRAGGKSTTYRFRMTYDPKGTER